MGNVETCLTQVTNKLIGVPRRTRSPRLAAKNEADAEWRHDNYPGTTLWRTLVSGQTHAERIAASATRTFLEAS